MLSDIHHGQPGVGWLMTSVQRITGGLRGHSFSKRFVVWDRNRTASRQVFGERCPHFIGTSLAIKRGDDSLEKTLMLGKIEGRRKSGWQRMRWLDGITASTAVSLSIVKDKEVWRAAVHVVAESDMMEQLNNNKRGGGGERSGSRSEGQVWRGGKDVFPETKRKA